MLSEFTKQFNNTDLDGIQAVKGVCLESMEKYPAEMILKVFKWLFIEQEIRYWNYSGRDMLWQGVPSI